MHIYIFGSICRGEYTHNSDIDLLACIEENTSHEFDISKFSIYQYTRLKELWEEGNPFAWHLYLESKLVYSSDGNDHLRDLGQPNLYLGFKEDFKKFKELYNESAKEFLEKKNITFNLSCMFLAVRNIATCYSLKIGNPVFSRYSPYAIKLPIKLNKNVFSILERARILATRGVGEKITSFEVKQVTDQLDLIKSWLREIEGA